MTLAYSNFTFDNVNFDLRKRSGFKYILQLLNICLVFKEKFKDFCFINFILKEEFIVGKQLAEFISENSNLNVIAIPYKSNSVVSMIKVHYFYNTTFYKVSPSSNCSLCVDRIILYFTILCYIYN